VSDLFPLIPGLTCRGFSGLPHAGHTYPLRREYRPILPSGPLCPTIEVYLAAPFHNDTRRRTNQSTLGGSTQGGRGGSGDRGARRSATSKPDAVRYSLTWPSSGGGGGGGVATGEAVDR
jgi:hypothetical protein